jgi:hypothetical protein
MKDHMDTSISSFSIPCSSGTFDKVRMETLLADVHKDDKIVVMNVFTTIETLRPYKLIHQYKVIATKKGYDVVGQLHAPRDDKDKKERVNDIIVSIQDLNIIMNMNPARIATCIVQMPADGSPQLVVRVLRSDQAIVYNDVQISHVHKKLRWW